MTDYKAVIQEKNREIEEYKHDLEAARKLIENLSSNNCEYCCRLNTEDFHIERNLGTPTLNNSSNKGLRDSSQLTKDNKEIRFDSPQNNSSIQAKNKNNVLNKQIKSSCSFENKKFETKLSEKLLNNKLFSSMCAKNELIATDNKGILDKKNLNLVSFIEKKLKHKLSKKSLILKGINTSKSITNISSNCKFF